MQPLRYMDDLDHATLSELYRIHAPALLTHLRVNTSTREDAEDILLDVFVAVLERAALRTLSPEEQRYWIWQVMRNKLVDYYRKRSRRQHIPLEVVSETAYENDELTPEWIALRNEEHQNLREVIQQLPPLQQEVLLLRFVNGLRAPEIARLLGKRDTAIRMLLSRTLNLLRQSYKKLSG